MVNGEFVYYSYFQEMETSFGTRMNWMYSNICVFALLYFLEIMTWAGAMVNGCIFLYLCICLVVFPRDYDGGWCNDELVYFFVFVYQG